MIRVLTSALLLLTIVYQVSAQGEANSLKGTPFKERIVTGGGFGLGFSQTQDFVSVSPVIGYQLTTRLMTGVGVTYRYTNYKVYARPIKLHDYGVNPFVRFTIYKNIFLQTEYEYLNYEFATSLTETQRFNFESFLGGGGFIQPISDRVAFYFMALYNFSYKDPVPGQPAAYRSPLVIRAGINVGRFGF